MNTTRTTIILNSSLLERLRWFVSNNKGTTMSEVVEKGVQYILDKTEKKQIDTVYDGLLSLSGIAKDTNPKLGNKGIDEILYGENGVWDGSLRDKP